MENMSAMDYEILIRRAYQCDRFGRKGADADIFRNLSMYDVESTEKPNDAKLKAQYEKRLHETKEYVTDAIKQGIKRLQKRNASLSDIDILNKHLSSVQKVNDRKTLQTEIRKALDSFINLKIDMD